jgi:hypothetical protein
MKISTIVTANAILLIAIGIGFTLYGPNLLAYFGVSDLPGGNSLLYWNIASFARMFGAAILALGLVLWGVKGVFSGASNLAQQRRELLFSLVFGFILITITALTQQASVWGSIAGWIIIAIFLIFTLLYIFSLAQKQPDL